MPRKQYQYHLIYKIKCIVNEKYYIGMHSTSNLEDGYMGSGKRIKNSIKKYGLENHTKEVLEFLPDRSSLKDREKEIVNQELLNDSLCMNLSIGGEGAILFGKSNGFFNKKRSRKHIKAMKLGHSKYMNNPITKMEFNNIMSNINKDTWDRGANTGFRNKTHTKKIRKRISKANSIHQSGKGNSQYGTCWIHNSKESKKIKKKEIDKWLNDGWIKGAKFKF